MKEREVFMETLQQFQARIHSFSIHSVHLNCNGTFETNGNLSHKVE